MGYFNAIRQSQPAAVFAGPGCADNHYEWTEPFCRDMDTIPSKIAMLTQHNYGGEGGKDTTHEIIKQKTDSLLMKNNLDYISHVADSLVKYASRGHIPFRMSETNSLFHGGMWGVSNAFVSALWALDYMYQLAYDSCAGVNFHGALEGPYTVFSKYHNVYRAHPIAYGILAFQIGSKGKFIKDTVWNNHINLDTYSVIDASHNIYTTIINKETWQNPDSVISLEVDIRNSNYIAAEYLRLRSDSLGDTTRVTLGEKVVDSLGRIPVYTWTSLPVTSHATHFNVPAGSAVVVKFIYRMGNSIQDNSGNNKHFLNLYPNPASDRVTISTEMTGHSVISVYNLQGQILMQRQMQQGKTDIDIREFAKGVYIVRLTGNAGAEAGRFIKE
ncbi:MAG: T9SS type A sorting domain-containing protein [Bacteroidetes bacterium]|nr:T9SS type A sorting domain-containing protein [Bacteroidota bacterium]